MRRCALTLSKQELIRELGLRPLEDEGGYYAERYVSEALIVPGGVAAMSTIYYMLTDDSPVGHFHRNSSDIVHFFHAGSPLRYTLIDPAGSVETRHLGPDPRQGHELQLVVRGGHWKATELCEGEYGLLSEAVTPAFAPEGRTIATRASLADAFPNLDARLFTLAYADR
jgi:predicted cupin superfamily sugar epimerase